MGNLLRTLEAVDPLLFKKEQEAAFYCDRRHKMMHLNPVADGLWELVGRLGAYGGG